MAFTSNADGFRGPEIESVTSRSILFMGDSFTMGYGVNDGEEFPSLVRNAMKDNCQNPVNVINTGMAGNGNGRWIKFLRSDAKHYNPSLIIFQVHGGDYSDNLQERLFELSTDRDLHELSIPAQRVRRMLQRILDSPYLSYSYLAGLAKQVQWYIHHSNLDKNIEGLPMNTNRELSENQLLIRMMEEVLTICKNEQWSVLFLLSDIPSERMADLSKLLEIHQVPKIVIPDKLARPELYFRVDLHWNTYGHKYVAEQLFKEIKCW